MCMINKGRSRKKPDYLDDYGRQLNNRNDKKSVVISCGPIPARLDSVKFITNRFKGGLAFKTAKELIDSGYNVTIVKWKFTTLTNELEVYYKLGKFDLVNVLDVFEYYNWYEEHACGYDAFIMAAAVANLTPSNPYDGKFPSHNYKVGEKFNIEFEIAPRAIDIIKQKNSRCCLIGYKLFDAKNDEELIEIAKHTLHDSKANIIFANTPSEAKSRKIALFQDDTHLEVDFDEHIQLIKQAIDSVYFKTILVDEPVEKKNQISLAKLAVKEYEKQLEDEGYNFGTIAIKVSDDGDFVTTSRGHNGEPVYVSHVEVDETLGLYNVYASSKATLNAPLLSEYMKDYDYVIHKHKSEFESMGLVSNINTSYIFPGTLEEYKMYDTLFGDKSVYEYGHGYLIGLNYKPVDWNEYHNLFPDYYFKKNEEIEKLRSEIEDKNLILEVGCNVNTDAGYFIDPNIESIEGSIKLSYDSLKFNIYDNLGSALHHKFKLIILRNSINYLSEDELKILQASLEPGGMMVANTFVDSPDYRVKEFVKELNSKLVKGYEFVYKDDDNGLIHHYLYHDLFNIYYHTFNITDVELLDDLGFKIEPYSKNSALVSFIK